MSYRLTIEYDICDPYIAKHLTSINECLDFIKEVNDEYITSFNIEHNFRVNIIKANIEKEQERENDAD